MLLGRLHLVHSCPVVRVLLAHLCPLRTFILRGPTLAIRLQGPVHLQRMARPSLKNWQPRHMIHPWRVDHRVEVSTRSHPNYSLRIDHTLQRPLANPRTPAIITNPNQGLYRPVRILTNRTQSPVGRRPYTQASHTRLLPLSPLLQEELATLRRRTIPIAPLQSVLHPNRITPRKPHPKLIPLQTHRRELTITIGTTMNYSYHREAGLRVSWLDRPVFIWSIS